jgi:hypothetical protein
MKSRIAGWIGWFVASVLVLAVCSSMARAQGWVDRTGPGGPSPRYRHAMCYDPVRGYVLMVGGYNQQGNPLSDVWSWDGSQWTSRGTGPNLGSWGLFWHAGLSKLVLCGNYGNSGYSWEWDGTNWVNQTSLPVSVVCGAYDPVRQEGVVWGSSGGPYGAAILNAQGWTFRPALSTAFVESIAWDGSSGRLIGVRDWIVPTIPYQASVLFYEWSGFGWNLINLPTSPSRFGAFAADSSSGRILMLDADAPWACTAGSASQYHTWVYANSAANRISSGRAPTPRGSSAMAYDSLRGRYVMFGGIDNAPCNGSYNTYGDTWEFDLGPSPSFTQYGTGCVGSRGIPHLQAQTNSVPRTGTTFSARVANLPWNAPTFLLFGLSNTTSSGLPLPFDLGIAGAPGCTLLASIDDIQAMTNVLGTAVWSLAVPTLPGAQFYVQAVAFEPAANALGVVLSNGGHGTLGF